MAFSDLLADFLDIRFITNFTSEKSLKSCHAESENEEVIEVCHAGDGLRITLLTCPS
jgi:hypothetical protein